MADLATQPAASTSPVITGTTDLLARFLNVRDLTRAWSALLSPEDQMVQSCSEASPVKWHLAHTTWFFDTFLLREFQPGYQPFHPDFIWLFNSYYKALGDHPEKSLRASFSRPSLDEVLAYRDFVNDNISQLLRSLEIDPATFPAETAREITSRIEIGLHHEQQHQELIASDIKHALFTNPLHPVLQPLPGIPPAPHKHAADWLSFSSGLSSFGHPTDPDAAFAFDNESPRHLQYVGAFELASSLVTVRDYLAFINDGGYTKSSLWLSDGWDAVTAEHWQAPLYWRQTTRSDWEIFTLHGFLPLADLLDTPVCHISYYEAEAYARWAGMRLPTEFEWETAAAQLAPNCAGFLTPHSLKFGFLHPTAHASIFGAVWQWTQSAYLPYPGYQPLGGALGEYNGKFMSGQMVLRGGSVVTPAGHMRATYRNFFQPQTRWQFSGIRLARDGAGVSSNPNSTGTRS
jgi:ergothioneine biosynthesis protein EgtB